MFQFFRNLTRPAQSEFSLLEEPGRGFFSEAFEDQFFPEHSPRVQAKKTEDQRRNAKITEVVSFLTQHFDKLAEEQAKGLADANVGDFTETRVAEFEEKLRLANRLVLRQADTRFGANNTDVALNRLGRNTWQFRRDNGCK